MEEESKGDFFQSPPGFENRASRSGGSNSAKRYLVIISSIIVIGLLIFGVTRFFSGGESGNNDPTPSPTAETFPTDIPPTQEPTPTEEPTPTKKAQATTTPTPSSTGSLDKSSGLNRSDLDIHVLNGNGVPGASKKAADYLEGLGYNVIQVGNAANFDYQQTQIQIKSESSKYLNLLKSDLSKNYTVGSASSDLGSGERPDAVVIIGKE